MVAVANPTYSQVLASSLDLSIEAEMRKPVMWSVHGERRPSKTPSSQGSNTSSPMGSRYVRREMRLPMHESNLVDKASRSDQGWPDLKERGKHQSLGSMLKGTIGLVTGNSDPSVLIAR